MPVSGNDEDAPGQALAVAAEGLYIANLMLAPGLCFLILLHLYFKHRASAPALAICHLKQTVNASIWAGVLLVVANLIIFLLGGYTSANIWVVVVIYFATCHSTLLLLGIVGLAKAMAGQQFIFPLVGGHCEE